MTETVLPDEVWLPPLAEKGMEVFNCFDRCVLLVGPRKASKTVSGVFKIWRHLWDTPGASVAVFSKTIKSAKDGGIWEDIINVGKMWMDSFMVGDTGLPLEYTTHVNGEPGPKVDGATKTIHFKIRNRHGGESVLRLFSLDNDHEVEAKIKNLRFSMVYFSELSNFKSREVLSVSILALRMLHLKYEQHQWIGDTNPAKEGKDSWIYKLWYIEKNMPPKTEAEKLFRKGLRLIEFSLDDNPFLDKRERMELEGLYAEDPGEYERHVEGKWTRGKGGLEKVFLNLIIPETHYVEDAIDIPKETSTLITGWDLGSSKNHGAVILEDRLIKGIPHWMVHDEHEVVGEQMTIEDFTYEFYGKMRRIEEFYEREFKWVHWSDDTAVNNYRAQTGGFDATIVEAVTGGRVLLQGADKSEGTIRYGIRIIRRLLKEKRLFVSKNCTSVIRMLEELEYCDDLGEKIDTHHHLKHIFDAFRYPIYMESKSDIDLFAKPSSINRGPRLISIGR